MKNLPEGKSLVKDHHPAASIFPLLEGPELEALTEDIRRHGQRDAIVLDEQDRIVDGRNRLRACEAAGVAPVFRRLPQGTDILAYVISANLHRRHLSADQRAAVAAELLPQLEAQARERQEATRIQNGKAPVREKVPAPEKGRATEKAGELLKVNRKYVEAAARLKAEDPETFEAVKAGKAGLRDVMRRRWIEEMREHIAREQPAALGLVEDLAEVPGRWRNILIDPPWPYNDRNCEGAAERHYSTMSLEEICALPIGELAHGDGCHLWLWTTWPMLRDRAPHQVLEAWGFRWVGEIIWHKPGLGVGRWLRPATEILILAVRGNLPLLRNDQRGFLEAPRGRHSEKPEEFYGLIESLSAGPHIELFARAAREGWSRWGLEAPAGPPAPESPNLPTTGEKALQRALESKNKDKRQTVYFVDPETGRIRRTPRTPRQQFADFLRRRMRSGGQAIERWRRSNGRSGSAGADLRAEALAALGLGAGANAEEISARFRELAIALHPDKGGDEKLFKAALSVEEFLLGERRRLDPEAVDRLATEAGSWANKE